MNLPLIYASEIGPTDQLNVEERRRGVEEQNRGKESPLSDPNRPPKSGKVNGSQRRELMPKKPWQM